MSKLNACKAVVCEDEHGNVQLKLDGKCPVGFKERLKERIEESGLEIVSVKPPKVKTSEADADEEDK